MERANGTYPDSSRGLPQAEMGPDSLEFRPNTKYLSNDKTVELVGCSDTPTTPVLDLLWYEVGIGQKTRSLFDPFTYNFYFHPNIFHFFSSQVLIEYNDRPSV
ncbi:hypothetical protein CEP52_010945 [Fusarium oligoseptatum]|uniref:Uncharacterized protein n=1 Tax=Fusarium oligoseptatum TaxID=2604345 RepID=A0A428T5S9_9HYPO|nr:hypothetical protein CEP52_010945 [Fusarium oligoseptatum]